MPRLSRSLLRQAWAENFLLPLLLRTCRALPSARSELRWLRDFVLTDARKLSRIDVERELARLCELRARGVPLQYLLGTEHFADLELVCRPGVLIPRQETAASVLHLVNRLRQNRQVLPQHFRMLDLCTGSGCIPLLFGHKYPHSEPTLDGSERSLQLLGVDISAQAVSLARFNQRRVLQQVVGLSTFTHGLKAKLLSLKNLQIVRANVLRDADAPKYGAIPLASDVLKQKGVVDWHCVISNPPYISPEGFTRDTARSVRNFEPKLALVPPTTSNCRLTCHGDTFYPEILKLADSVNARILLVEVADLTQALRVADRASKQWDIVEIWRDQPGLAAVSSDHTQKYRVIGRGNGRYVFAARGEGINWTCDANPK